jgi:hypothetical protein
LGWSAGGRKGRGFVREVEVQEDGRDDGRIGQEREDPHLGAADGTQERQQVVDACEQDGPTDSGRGGGPPSDRRPRSARLIRRPATHRPSGQ